MAALRAEVDAAAAAERAERIRMRDMLSVYMDDDGEDNDGHETLPDSPSSLTADEATGAASDVASERHPQPPDERRRQSGFDEAVELESDGSEMGESSGDDGDVREELSVGSRSVIESLLNAKRWAGADAARDSRSDEPKEEANSLDLPSQELPRKEAPVASSQPLSPQQQPPPPPPAAATPSQLSRAQQQQQQQPSQPATPQQQALHATPSRQAAPSSPSTAWPTTPPPRQHPAIGSSPGREWWQTPDAANLDEFMANLGPSLAEENETTLVGRGSPRSRPQTGTANGHPPSQQQQQQGRLSEHSLPRGGASGRSVVVVGGDDDDDLEFETQWVPPSARATPRGSELPQHSRAASSVSHAAPAAPNRRLPLTMPAAAASADDDDDLEFETEWVQPQKGSAPPSQRRMEWGIGQLAQQQQSPPKAVEARGPVMAAAAPAQSQRPTQQSAADAAAAAEKEAARREKQRQKKLRQKEKKQALKAAAEVEADDRMVAEHGVGEAGEPAQPLSQRESRAGDRHTETGSSGTEAATAAGEQRSEAARGPSSRPPSIETATEESSTSSAVSSSPSSATAEAAPATPAAAAPQGKGKGKMKAESATPAPPSAPPAAASASSSAPAAPALDSDDDAEDSVPMTSLPFDLNDPELLREQEEALQAARLREELWMTVPARKGRERSKSSAAKGAANTTSGTAAGPAASAVPPIATQALPAETSVQDGATLPKLSKLETYDGGKSGRGGAAAAAAGAMAKASVEKAPAVKEAPPSASRRKTPLCKYFQIGTCRNGDACRFEHTFAAKDSTKDGSKAGAATSAPAPASKAASKSDANNKAAGKLPARSPLSPPPPALPAESGAAYAKPNAAGALTDEVAAVRLERYGRGLLCRARSRREAAARELRLEVEAAAQAEAEAAAVAAEAAATHISCVWRGILGRRLAVTRRNALLRRSAKSVAPPKADASQGASNGSSGGTSTKRGRRKGKASSDAAEGLSQPHAAGETSSSLTSLPRQPSPGPTTAAIAVNETPPLLVPPALPPWLHPSGNSFEAARAFLRDRWMAACMRQMRRAE